MLVLASILALVGFIAMDQVLKVLVIYFLKPIGSITLIPHVLDLHYVENTGVAFGMFSNMPIILSIIVAVIAAIGIYIIVKRKISSPIGHWALVVMIAGGIGNFLDRIFYGFVVDYIEFTFVDFAVFNFADMLITCGAGVMIVYLIVDMVRLAKKEKQEKQEAKLESKE